MLSISHGLLTLILHACRTEHPHEACGFLLGRDTTVLFGIPVENTSDDPAHRYHIDRTSIAAVHHRAISLGVTIIGAWHSHPDGPDTLSRADMSGSPDPEFLHLLIGRDESVQAFRVLTPARVVQVPIALRHANHASPRAGLAIDTGVPPHRG